MTTYVCVCTDCGKVMYRRNRRFKYCVNCRKKRNINNSYGRCGYFSISFDPLGRMSPLMILKKSELDSLIQRDELPEGAVVERNDGVMMEYNNGELIAL